MSAAEIIEELPKLSDTDRQAVLAKLLKLANAAQCTPSGAIDLKSLGIDQKQAAELRGRLKSFAEDWDRPEAAIYDENPAR